MRTIATWSGLALLAMAGSATAQTYPTALPVTGPDQIEYEQRLANILEFARPNQVTRFRLPSGRTVSVRSYQPTVVSGGSGPCRGYRVDLSGSEGFMAVDGFRCRENASNRWQLIEPETVLAQSGAPARAPNQPALTEPPRAPNEPLYGENDPAPAPAVQRSASSVPVPRRRPNSPAPVVAAAPADTATPETILPPGEVDPTAGDREAAFEGLRAPTTPPELPVATTDGPLDLTNNAQTATIPSPETPDPASTAGLTQTAERTLLTAEPQDGEPAYVTQLRERIERARRLEEEVANAVREGQTPQTSPIADRDTAIITPTADPTNAGSDPIANAPASTIYREPATIAPALSSDVDVALANRSQRAAEESDLAALRPVANAPARIVGERPSEPAGGFGADQDIITALKNLRYLSVGSTPSPAAVQSAVDEFATDERFALPISRDALMTRLNDARERSASLPDCSTAGIGATLCIR